jgi:hypothetical protein
LSARAVCLKCLPEWFEVTVRKTQIEHRPTFVRGVIVGLLVVAVKFVVVLPVDIADILYGASLLVTLVITFGDFMEWKAFTLHPKILDFILGFLFPLDAYAVLQLFGFPLPD